MKRTSFFLCLLATLLVIQQSFASDTTRHKNPVYMSLRLAYTNTRAFGSLPDMVTDLDNQYGVKGARQKDGSGFGFNLDLQIPLKAPFFLETGIGYIQKQVNPEEGAYMLYKDSLKTGYLSIPLLLGANVGLNPSGSISLVLEAGFSGDVKLADKSTTGPDRAGFSTHPVAANLQLGGGLRFATSDNGCFFVRYDYISNFTHAYTEQLYWGAPGELIRTRSYQLQTSSFSMGFQWLL